MNNIPSFDWLEVLLDVYVYLKTSNHFDLNLVTLYIINVTNIEFNILTLLKIFYQLHVRKSYLIGNIASPNIYTNKQKKYILS